MAGSGAPRVGVRDVAEAAGVSLGTVSNVLNRPETVAPTTLARVRRVIDELGYVRNESARTLRAGTSRTIGLVVLDVANPFFTDVAGGVEEVADEHDVVVTLCNTGDVADREDRHLDQLLEQRVRGLLITPLRSHTPRLERFLERDIPVVLLDRGAGDTALCSVAVDDVRGGTLAGEHLRALGHERIAFVGGPLTIPQVADRLAGVRAAGLNEVEVVETGALRIEDGATATRQLLARPRGERSTGIFCANDLLALGALQAATSAGVAVPHDLAIVGYDDIEYARGAAVPLTSIRQPRSELGRAAAQLLFEELDDATDHVHEQVVFSPELIVRESTTDRHTAQRPST